MSAGTGAGIRAWLDGLGPAVATDVLQDAVRDVLATGELEVIPGLLTLMCRYDPHRAERLRQVMLLGCEFGALLGELDAEAPR